jgi:hypothetical protein
MVQAFRQFSLSTSQAEKTFPCLGFLLQSTGEFHGAMVVKRHFGVSKVGDIVNEPVAGACVRGASSWVAKFGALAELGHGFN